MSEVTPNRWQATEADEVRLDAVEGAWKARAEIGRPEDFRVFLDRAVALIERIGVAGGEREIEERLMNHTITTATVAATACAVNFAPHSVMRPSIDGRRMVRDRELSWTAFHRLFQRHPEWIAVATAIYIATKRVKARQEAMAN